MTSDGGVSQPEPVPLEPGDTLRSLVAGQLVAGRFRLETILGRGGIGIVWKARDECLGEKACALKFLSETLANDLAAVGELKGEVARCQELSHPHILRVHDLVEDRASGLLAISMEVASGGTLAALRASRPKGWLEPSELRNWVQQLCLALEYAHTQARVVHRDLKPANLLLDERQRLKVADFGIAQAVRDSITRLTGSKATSGTPAYMSPDQALGKAPRAADDIYGLGATLFDLLTGTPPYKGANQAKVVAQLLDMQLSPPSIRQRREELRGMSDELPAVWEEVVAQCLSKDSASRPSSAKEIAGRLLRNPIPGGGREPGMSTTRRMSSGKWLRAAGVIAVLLALSALAAWLATRQHPRAIDVSPTPSSNAKIADAPSSQHSFDGTWTGLIKSEGWIIENGKSYPATDSFPMTLTISKGTAHTEYGAGQLQYPDGSPDGSKTSVYSGGTTPPFTVTKEDGDLRAAIQRKDEGWDVKAVVRISPDWSRSSVTYDARVQRTDPNSDAKHLCNTRGVLFRVK